MEYKVQSFDLTLGTYIGVTLINNALYIVYRNRDGTVDVIMNSSSVTLVRKPIIN